MYEIVDKCIVMYYNVNELEEKNCIKLLYEFCIVTLIAHVCERVLKRVGKFYWCFVNGSMGYTVKWDDIPFYRFCDFFVVFHK